MVGITKWVQFFYSIFGYGCLWLGVFMVPRAMAAECGVLRLQTHDSAVSKIADNKCKANAELSINSVIVIKPGARVWLESMDNADHSAKYQLVCQNISAQTQQLKIISQDHPWLMPLNPRCEDWQNNLLTCKKADNQQEELVCAIVEIPRQMPSQSPDSKTGVNVSQLPVPQTAVVVRGVERPRAMPPANEHAILVNIVKPYMQLCRTILKYGSPISMGWTVSKGRASNATIYNAVDPQFADCALEALQHTRFPANVKETQLDATF